MCWGEGSIHALNDECLYFTQLRWDLTDCIGHAESVVWTFYLRHNLYKSFHNISVLCTSLNHYIYLNKSLHDKQYKGGENRPCAIAHYIKAIGFYEKLSIQVYPVSNSGMEGQRGG